MRADARRNYENLLAAAADVIASEGTEASLEEIARRAGVGIGTLYRHFPTRDALLEALLGSRFDSLATLGSQLLDEPDALVAVTRWLRELASQTGAYRGLANTLISALNDPESELYVSCRSSTAAGTALVERAQQAGQVRADVMPSEAFTLAYSLAFVLEHDPYGVGRVDRLLTLLMDGLRPR